MSKAKKVQSSSQQRTLWQETWRRFKKNKLAVAGMIFLIALVVIAIATIIIDAVNPSIYETYVIKQNLRERLAPPSAAHIFGQDEFGRDMLMRILWSIRSSLFMGALSIALSCIVGGLFGAIAGYYGGKLDNVIMRIMDVFLAIPSMLLAIAIVAAFGTSLVNVLLAIGISYVPTFARTVRAPILTVKGQDYIEAAKAVGASDFRIIFKYILPNSMAPIIVQVTWRGRCDSFHRRSVIPGTWYSATDTGVGRDAFRSKKLYPKLLAHHRYSGTCNYADHPCTECHG